MVRESRKLLFVVALAVALHPSASHAQTGTPPPARVTIAAIPDLAPPPVEALAPAPDPGYPPFPANGQPGCVSYEDCNGPLLRGDPLLDRPGYPLPGWLASLDVGVVGPHFKNRLSAGVPIAGDTVSVQLPAAELDWTGAPRLVVGYRLPEGFGEVLVAYRSLVTEGTALITGFDLFNGSAFLKSRLNVNVVQIDYASREFALGPNWDMRWKTGVRFASVFFDARAVGPFTEERTSNDFRGVGPEAGLTLARFLPRSGLTVFGNVELATLIGTIKQGFEENVHFGSFAVGGARTVRQDQAAPVLNLQAGLSWSPPRNSRIRLSTGYEYEQWWTIGKAGDSKAELSDQGIFFRAEVNF